MIHKLKGDNKNLNGYSSSYGFTCPALLENFFMWHLWWHYMLKYLFTFLLEALKMIPVTSYHKGQLSRVTDTPRCHCCDFNTAFPELVPPLAPLHASSCPCHGFVNTWFVLLFTSACWQT